MKNKNFVFATRLIATLIICTASFNVWSQGNYSAAHCVNAVPLHAAMHSNSTDFYMTQDPNLMDYLGPMGFTYAGIIAKVPNGEVGAYPLKRHYKHSATAHLYTLHESESQSAQAHGWVYENDEGMLFDQPTPGTMPLFRLFFQNGTDEMIYYTADIKTINNLLRLPGWNLQWIAGYVCPV